MGNTFSSHSCYYSHSQTQAPQQTKVNPALCEFIEEECPLVNQALMCCDTSFRNAVVEEFSKNIKGDFRNMKDVLIYIERKRLERVAFLTSISEARFAKKPETKFSCIPAKINGRITITYCDTGCGMSCLTKKAAYRLGLEGAITKAVTGVATGFGNHSNIVGFLPHIAIQTDELLFAINFLVIDKASTDLVLIGADFLGKQKIKLDYRKGEVMFPRQIIDEKKLKFMPLIKNEKMAANLVVVMVENVRVPRTFGFLSDIVNERNIFIDIKVNGVPFQAMVDSGAESSMISRRMASRLKLLKYTDLTKCRVSHGLGPVVVIGRIPPIPIEFDAKTMIFVPLEVLHGTEVDCIILGSDFLTCYGCEVDFESKHLRIPLDSPRSYKLREKVSQLSPTDSWLRDTGLGPLMGFQYPKVFDESTPVERRSDQMSNNVLPNDHTANRVSKTSTCCEKAILTPPQSSADIVPVKLESLNAVTISL